MQGRTALLTDSGLMCCLGFDAVACGIRESELLNVGSPANLSAVLPEGYADLRLVDRYGDGGLVNSDIVREAININDDVDRWRSDEDKERDLKPVLMQLGWDDVVFVD